MMHKIMRMLRRNCFIPLVLAYCFAVAPQFAYADVVLSSGHSDNTTTTYGYAKYPCGTQGFDNVGNRYVFMLGAASLAAHNVVAISCTGTTTTAAVRLTETVAAKGYPLAIAMSAPTASQYGWFQVYGKAVVSSYADSANAEYLATSTDGYIAPVDWGGTTPIHGIAFADAASGSGVAYVNYPCTGN